MIRTKQSAFSLLTLAINQAVYAVNEAREFPMLGEVAVTETREAIPLSESSASISVIKEEAIKFTAPTRPQQLLTQIPGVAVNVTNGEGHTMGIRQKIGTDPV